MLTNRRTLERIMRNEQQRGWPKPGLPLSRREALVGLGAVGAVSVSPLVSHAAAPAARAIDFHHHFNPPFLVNAAAQNRVGGNGGDLNWSLQYSLEDMDKAGIRAAVISPSTGFAERVEPSARGPMIRKVNDYGAELVRDHK